jgi:hypothetical protein
MVGALTPSDPFAELADLRRRFARVYRRAGWSPAGHVAAGDRRDAPGGRLRPPGRPSWSQGYEVAIEVEDGILTVSGERQEDRTDMDGGRYAPRASLRRLLAVARPALRSRRPGDQGADP